MTSLVELQDVEICRGSDEVHRRIALLEIPIRSRVGIIGGCDSGKTALAYLLAGVADRSHARGTVKFEGVQIEQLSPRDRARKIAFVPTDASLVFSGMRTTVSGELELSLQIVGYGTEAKSKIAKCVGSLLLEPLLERDPFTLSGGEQVRAALAIALVKSPNLIILDDIFSALDTEASEIVRRALMEIHASGATIVEFHSCPPSWISTFDECVFLCADQVLQGQYADIWRAVQKCAPDLLPFTGQVAGQPEDETKSAPASTGHLGKSLESLPRSAGDELKPPLQDKPVSNISKALTTRDWTFRYPNNGFQLGPLSFSLPRGQAVAILGPNGSGKTTLLRTLALLLVAQGSVEVHASNGSISAPPTAQFRHTWARHVLYAFQNPDDQIYLPTVWRELTETARVCGLTNFDGLARNMASMLMLSEVLDQAPVDLPRPLRRLVTLGSCFVARAPLLLLDEPTAGLDHRQKHRVGLALNDYLTKGGTAVVVSHDSDFIMQNCSHAFLMERGRVVGHRTLSRSKSQSSVSDNVSYDDPCVA